MTGFIEFIIFFGLILIVAAFRWRASVWSWVIFALLFIYTCFSSLNFYFLIPAWLIYFIIVAITQIKSWRLRLLTKPVYYLLQKTMPAISETENIAIEAGDVWWERDLFCGNPDWKQLIGMPKSALKEEEQAFLDNEVNTLCEMLDDWQINFKDYDLSKPIWDYIKTERFWALNIDPKYGGRGFSAQGHSAVITKIATRSASAAVTVMVPNSLGPGELITHYGTEEQKQYYLPRLARGEEIPCFGLTSLEVGSDAAGMVDSGIICKGMHEGKEIIGIKLNFFKRYITLAPVATVMGLAIKLYDPDHLIGNQEKLGITLCLVPTNHPGVEHGKRHLPMNLAFLNGPLRGKNAFIPLDWVIGGRKMCGQGWRMLMECLSVGRGISLPSLSTALAQTGFLTTGAYALLRKQFKISIGKFEGVESALATIGGLAYISEATRRMTSNGIDQGQKPAIATAITKYHLTEMAREITDCAMDIHGGRGIQLGPRNYLAAAQMAIPVAITVEGANILTRNLIIFGQGALRCHPYLLNEIKAATHLKDIYQFDELLYQHLGYALGNFSKTLLMGLTGGRLNKVFLGSELDNYLKQLTRMSTALAFVADVTLLILGGKVKRKENLSARLGDVLSYLYLASAVIKYYYDQDKPDSDKYFMAWTLQYCLYHCGLAFDNFFNNFPLRLFGIVLKKIVFPWGQSYKLPSDKLEHSIAEMMMQPNALRKRLTQLVYVGDGKSPIGRIEQAFEAILKVDAIQTKLNDAVKKGQIAHDAEFEKQVEEALKNAIINSEEAKNLMEALQLRTDALQVDEFNFDDFRRG